MYILDGGFPFCTASWDIYKGTQLPRLLSDIVNKGMQTCDQRNLVLEALQRPCFQA